MHCQINVYSRTLFASPKSASRSQVPTKVQSARVHAATALALVLAFAIAFPALAGEPPYPILLVHGLNSSHEQWISDGTVSALASRYGMSLQLTEEQFFRFCLNYDDDHERNNLNYETISIGDPPRIHPSTS